MIDQSVTLYFVYFFVLLNTKMYFFLHDTNGMKECSLKFSLLKKAILELGVWEPQKYFHIKSFHCLSNLGHQLFFEHPKVLEHLGPNVEETMDRFDMEVFLGLPDTQSPYSFFQQAKFKRALLVTICPSAGFKYWSPYWFCTQLQESGAGSAWKKN